MKLHRISIACLLMLIATGLSAAGAGSLVVNIVGYDTMKFSVTKIEAQPGQKITVELSNAGVIPKEAMGHNWVLLKAGVDPISYCNSAITAKAEGYEPKALASQVIASIPLLGPKESAKVTFTAPKAPGTYHYVCSFPAHCMAGMKGVLIVK